MILTLEKKWHLSNKRSAVYKHICETSLQPNFIVAHGYEPKDVASILEGQYKDKYEKEGWQILNRAKTGSLGASNFKYSEKHIIKIAKQCDGYKMFREKYRKLYNAAKRLHILCKIKEILEPQIKITNWKEHPDIIEEIASQCHSHNEFETKHNAAAKAAVSLGIYDSITSHMPPKRIRVLTKEDIFRRIKERQYSNYTEFTHDQGTYNAANKLEILDVIKDMLPQKEKEPYYPIEYLASITSQYETLSQLNKEHHNIYEYIRKYKLQDKLFDHFKKNEHRVMSDDFCINESKKYKNATELSLKDRTVYNYLRENHLLDIAFPNRRKTKKNER